MRDMLGGACLLIFAAFAGLQATSRERIETDEEHLKTLAKASLAEDATKPLAHDWPRWRGPAFDGIAVESIAESWPEDGPKKLWEVPTGDGYASIAVGNGVAYVFYQSSEEETLAAHDAQTGELRWKFAYPDRYVNAYGNGPRSTPTIDGDRVYLVGAKGVLHALDAKTGTKLWRKNLLAEFDAPTPKWGISFSPLVDGDRLIVVPGGTKGTIAALDKRTGDVLWTRLSEGGGYSSPIIATVAGVRQILAFTAGGLVGIEPETGKLLWRFPWTTPWDCNIATPIVAGDYVFITSGYDRGCALAHIVKTDEGWIAKRVYENQRLCSHFASCVRFGETIYGFNESTLVALDLRTGAIRWRQRGFGKGSVAGVGDRLLVLGEGGACELAEVSSGKYAPLARFQFSDDRCWSVPVIANGRLYLRDQKTLACFDVAPTAAK